MTHPYRRDIEPGRFSIVYVGMAEQFHVLRVRKEGRTAMETLMLRGKIVNWMMENARGGHFVGNGFGASKKHPTKFPYHNPNGKDLFVLLDNLPDLSRFEEEFGVEKPPATWSQAFAAARVAQ